MNIDGFFLFFYWAAHRELCLLYLSKETNENALLVRCVSCLSSFWLFTETLADSAETLFTKNDQEGDGVRSDFL